MIDLLFLLLAVAALIGILVIVPGIARVAKVSNTKAWLAFLAASVVVVATYAIWALYKTEHNARQLESEAIVPQVGNGNVSEVGYVIKESTNRSLWEQKKAIMWSVKIPVTNKIWGCDWEAGFSEFKENDAVLLTHKPDGGPDGVDWDGYLIGMHDQKKNKVARVWVLDAEDIRRMADEWQR